MERCLLANTQHKCLACLMSSFGRGKGARKNTGINGDRRNRLRICGEFPLRFVSFCQPLAQFLADLHQAFPNFVIRRLRDCCIQRNDEGGRYAALSQPA